MKRIIVIVALSNLSLSQSQVTEIVYEVELKDAMTGLKPRNLINPQAAARLPIGATSWCISWTWDS